MEVLIRVDTSLLRCCPTSCVDTRGALAGVIFLHPVGEQGDCVLSSRVATKCCRNTLRRASHDTYGLVVRDHRLVDVDVVGVEVVGDVAIFASPCLECLKLALRLAHVGVKVVEVTELLGPESCVGIGGVVALVMLDVYKDIVLLSLFEELLVVLEQLDGWFCDKNVNAALNGVQSDRVVGGVRSEDSNFG